MTAKVQMSWRGAVGDGELNALHAEAFGHAPATDAWATRLERFSLGWLVLRVEGRLAGFVNLAWDGGAHAFLLDLMVAQSQRRQGFGARLTAEAVSRARAAGCQWLHVDFEPAYRDFYLRACGFRPSEAGLIAL